ncbi:MAG: hypothetical protein QOJ65_1096 [Fimbriimonadaceae bacterium]|jgi:hypothetical protein|nr:hypothetical protein [Fimbriimonadaceae bacterium]
MARVKQRLKTDRVQDIRGETRQKLIDAGIAHKVKKGDRIAVSGSSRGFGGFIELIQGICDAVRFAGGEPFVFPAMGSHGGATAEGQVEVLRRLGLTEETATAPIQSTMETVELGTSKTGARAHADRLALEADGIIILGCPKIHPENAEGIASGLCKITTVGLGKQRGAQQAHSHGLWDSVQSVPEISLAKAKVLFGVAMVENSMRMPALIEVVPGTYEAFLETDRRLLAFSKQYFAELPFQQLDLLIIDRVGKNISGTCMDLNVIGKWRLEGGERKPDIHRLVPLSLTPESLGNGIGVGLADFTTQRLADEYSPENTYINVLTATEPGAMNSWEGGLPMVLPTDRDAIEVGLYSALPRAEPRVCRIKSTAELDEFWISPALMRDIEGRPGITVEDAPESWAYDSRGNLF